MQFFAPMARCAVAGVGLALLSHAAFAADDTVAAAKAAIVRYAGPQTVWQGPTSAPKPMPGMSIVYLSGDEQNDISREYGLYMKAAAEKLGWKLTVIDGKGSPSTWVSGFNQAIALKPNGIAIFADAKSLQGPIQTAVDHNITVIGLHAASLPGPAPDLHLFVNIQEDPREIGKAEADWAIADSNGTAKVVVVTHNEYQIAATKSGQTRDAVIACKGCKCSTMSISRPRRRHSGCRNSPQAGCSASAFRSTSPRWATTILTLPFPRYGAPG